jgi:hypothetical protein
MGISICERKKSVISHQGGLNTETQTGEAGNEY